MAYLTIVGIAIFFGGLVGIITIIMRRVPTLAKLSQEPQSSLNGKIGEEIRVRLRGIKYSNFLPLALGQLEKNLRKFRLFILKIDNLFVDWIKKSRDKSIVWTIRSRAWMEHRRLKKKEETQLLEKLDKVEVSQTIKKIEQEVAKDEDKALKEKIENVAEIEEALLVEDLPIESQKEDKIELPVGEEKKYIDLIADNPKDTGAYRALGSIYLDRKNYSDARACFRQVLKLNPADEEIKNKLESIKGLRGVKKTTDNVS